MKNFIRDGISTTLVCIFFFNSLPAVLACGPFTIDPVFSLKQHADFPLREFMNGRVGIVPETFGLMSLFVFYRQLNNLPLTKAEQVQVADAMAHRIGSGWSEDEAASKENSNPDEVPDYFAEWQTVRAKVLNDKTKIETKKQVPGEYNYFTNCLEGAFDNATKTLKARISKYGIDGNTKEWVKGQDVVFSNCEAAVAVPETLTGGSPDWLRNDRQYQIAAAQFYMGDFAASRESFENIAANPGSVWNKTAKFVIARTLIRQASFADVSGDEATKTEAEQQRTDLLKKAADQLQKVLDDDSMRDFHASANRLMGLVKYRATPQERKKELAEILIRPTENANIYNDLTDYRWLLENTENQAYEKGSEIDRKEAEQAGKEYDYDYQLKLRDLPSELLQNDLTDWLFTFQAEDGFAHALDKFKSNGGLEWFVAALSKADPKSPETVELLAEADKIQPNSPAYATVRFHQIRLLMENGRQTEAKQKITEVFSGNFNNLPISTQNKFLSQKMIFAENLGEFLKSAQRRAALFVWSDDGNESGDDLTDDKVLSVWENRTMFDTDAVAFFNEKMPLSVLRQAALSPELPAHLKKFLIVAVWTRAVVLGNQTIEREFAPLVLRSAREYAPLFSKYVNSSNSTNREAAALIAILRYPVIQPYVPVGFGRENSQAVTIDSNRGNWWCAEQQTEDDRGHYDHYLFDYPKVYPNFLTDAQKTEAEREHRQIISLGNSATFLVRRAVEFAKNNPNFAQTPEILHLGVRATRYGCTDAETGKYSKEAFQILHQRYPNSVWTKQTPYWFGAVE